MSVLGLDSLFASIRLTFYFSSENVDAAFLEEDAADSHVPESALTGADDEFDGFTFVDDAMAQK